MVAGDRYRIPLRNVLRRPLETVDDESERWLDGIDPRVLRHVLLKDVVLDSAAKLLRIDALLCRGGDVEAVENHGGAVDRHRRRDLVQRYAVEERLHVGEARDCNAALANLSL